MLNLPDQILENIRSEKSIFPQEFVTKLKAVHLSVFVITMSLKELPDTCPFVSLTGGFFLLTFVLFHVRLYFTIVAAS
jgi:hypothetical protein